MTNLLIITLNFIVLFFPNKAQAAPSRYDTVCHVTGTIEEINENVVIIQVSKSVSKQGPIIDNPCLKKYPADKNQEFIVSETQLQSDKPLEVGQVVEGDISDLTNNVFNSLTAPQSFWESILSYITKLFSSFSPKK